MGELIERYFRQYSLMSVSEQIDTRTAAGRSYQGIADALNQAGVRPLLGAQWYPNVVRRMVLRTAAMHARRIA
jgi:hypothetical protein